MKNRIRVTDFLALADQEQRLLDQELAEIEKEAQRHQSVDRRLSAKAFVAGALARAKATTEQAMALRQEVDREPGLFVATRRLILETRRGIRQRSYSRVPEEARRLPYPGAVAVNAESVDPFLAFAVGVMCEAEEHPDSFGTRDSADKLLVEDEHARKLGEMKQDIERQRAWLRTVLALPETKAILGGNR